MAAESLFLIEVIFLEVPLTQGDILLPCRLIITPEIVSIGIGVIIIGLVLLLEFDDARAIKLETTWDITL